ncbi:slipin family protein [Hahella ganghwensis]|uniref:slipin family protein n=1 Tax=Hahella ganghwensis TaxID=286420 RepID=UPI00036E908A|nr:slipin family protein [Hahella ganghwensis]
MFWQFIDVADDEKVLLYRDRHLFRVLDAGRYRFWGAKKRFMAETCSLKEVEVRHPKLDVLLTLDTFRQEVDVTMIGLNEVGIVRRDGQIKSLLEPGARLVTWKSAINITVEAVDISESYRLAPELMSQLDRLGLDTVGNRRAWIQLTVPEQSMGMLFVDGELVSLLKAGRYGYWTFNRELSSQVHDLKWQSLEVSGQEILTKDRVSLRLNLNAVYRIVDVVAVSSKVKSSADYVYRRLQLASREAIGTRTLDELLADKSAIAKSITKTVTESFQAIGLELEQVGVKDIILPGEMKEILNQVVQAQKTAEANLIRRREETAATRSLHNTAKMMEGNPVLLRLKELEALEKVADRIGHLTVYGGLDGLMNDLVSIAGKGFVKAPGKQSGKQSP